FVEAVSDALADVVERAAGDTEHPVIMEAGAGTGYYLAHTLDLIAGARGVGLDVSVPAAKHLAKAHPRVGAVVADVWEQLPTRTGSVHAL
ncbi:class I SAM-dependent methyltransferase, partial [Escherichia coli]|uniref:class I SAM-dependent methyltransferase n=1 Tax=Escherichia coli TaxID=562 RepID=UPI002708E0A0